MKVAIISANLGNFDPPSTYVEQKLSEDVELSIIQYNDKNFLPRTKAMTPRLQARIPKMFGWEMAPGFEYYIWLDASLSILHKDSVMWFLDKCLGYHMALFKHPDRNSIFEEYSYIKKRVEDKSKYLTSRYEGELLEEQLRAVSVDEEFVDDTLYATTAFVYKNNGRVRQALTDWWVHTSRYHIVDQLALPFVVYMNECRINKIEENLYKIPYITYTRNWKENERSKILDIRA